MFGYTWAQSQQEPCDYKAWDKYTLEAFYNKYFSKCIKGSKLGSAFIRGMLTETNRKDEFLPTAKLLVIDADGGVDGKPTPEAKKCHEALKALGYSHIIYTTHSHKPDYHKYRAIVELSAEIEQHELHANMSELIDQLKAQGVSLHYAHEMDTWSQPWFFPRSDNPETFETYSYFDGGCFTTINVEMDEAEKSKFKARSKKTSEERQSSGDSETLDEMWNNIRTGKEFHNSMRNLTYQMAKEGTSRALILSIMKDKIETALELITDSNRIIDLEQRLKDLERLVDGGIQRAADEAASDFEMPVLKEESTDYTPPPMPPGRLGRAIQQCLSSMPRPQIEFAFPMILGSVAAICGAKFNAYSNQGSGLNLSFTVVAGTGYGKGQIGKFFNALFVGGLNGKVINLSGKEGASSFIGSNNYTAPKSLHKDLSIGRSKISIMQEAGIMLGAKSGNTDELSAYIMENFINSDYESFASTRAYSAEDNSLKTFRAPAISLILESTEESLAQSLKDMNALESGFIPRQTMFKVAKKPPMNRDRSAKRVYDFDQDIIDHYKVLISECADVQAKEIFDINTVRLTDDQFDEYCNYEDNFSNDYNYDKVATIISTRMSHKMVKFAAICSVFNSWRNGDMEVTDEAWEWAKQMAKWEMDNINHNLSYMKNDNEYDLAFDKIKERLVATYNHKGTTQKQKDAKVIKYSLLLNRQDAEVNKLAQAAKVSTDVYIDRILKQMEKMGWLKILDSHPAVRQRNGSGKAIQLLAEIIDALK